VELESVLERRQELTPYVQPALGTETAGHAGASRTGRLAKPPRSRAWRRQATVNRLRPFARRRFRTKRPFFVLMRTRNPCVR
jgi:hypothetical protein